VILCFVFYFVYPLNLHVFELNLIIHRVGTAVVDCIGLLDVALLQHVSQLFLS